MDNILDRGNTALIAAVEAPVNRSSALSLTPLIKTESQDDTSLADLVRLLAKAELGRDRERDARSPLIIPIGTQKPDTRTPSTEITDSTSCATAMQPRFLE